MEELVDRIGVVNSSMGGPQQHPATSDRIIQPHSVEQSFKDYNINNNNYNNTILYLLQQICRDLNKVKRFLTFKSTTNIRRNLPQQDDYNQQSTSTSVQNSAIMTTSSSCDGLFFNDNIEKLLQNRFLILHLLHLECTILRYMKLLEQQMNRDVGALLSMYKYAPIKQQLEEIIRAYYALLNKLSYGMFSHKDE